MQRLIHAALPLLALLGLALVAAAPACAEGDQAGLSLAKPWIRFVLPNLPAAGYFTLANTSDTARELTGASSPACKELMLHRSVNENGVEKMEMVMSLAVPAHGTLTFAPGGYHLMCMSPSQDMRPGKSVPVTLLFKDGATLTADFAVRGATGD